MNWIINNIIPFVIIALATRSMILLVKSWGNRNQLDSCIYFVVSAAAIYYSMSQLVDGYRLHDRGQYTVMIMFAAFCYAIMKTAKQSRDEVFSLPNMIKRHYNLEEKEALKKVGAKEKNKIETVTVTTIRNFQPGKFYYSDNKKEALLRLDPIGNTEVVRAFLDAGGEFGNQVHPDMNERCQVICGRVRERGKEKIYCAGDEIHWPSGTVHNLEALEYSELLAFLEVVNVTSAN